MTDLSVPSTTDRQAVRLHGEVSIEALSERREELLRALEDGLPVALDLSAVERIDTAGLQLVTAFVLDMRRSGREVRVAASAAVQKSARLAGLSALLGLSA